MKKEQPLHLRLNFGEAIDSKKSILLTEVCLLEILGRLENYKQLRRKELEKKQRLRDEVKQIISEINKILKDLPNIKIESNLQIKREEFAKESKEGKTKRHIEFELREIKKQIERLEGN